MAKPEPKDNQAQREERAKKAELLRRRRNTARNAKGKSFKLDDEQLGTLRAHATPLGGGCVATRKAEAALVKLGLLEQRLGGLKVTGDGKAVLHVNKARFR